MMIDTPPTFSKQIITFFSLISHPYIDKAKKSWKHQRLFSFTVADFYPFIHPKINLEKQAKEHHMPHELVNKNAWSLHHQFLYEETDYSVHFLRCVQCTLTSPITNPFFPHTKLHYLVPFSPAFIPIC